MMGKNKKVLYAECNYGEKEIEAVLDVLKKSHLTLVDGDNVKLFEKKVSFLFNKKFGVMVNSGSSANTLALAVLKAELKGEVITPALTFSTTVAPIVQLGLVPVFVDIDPETLQIDPNLIEQAVTKKTVALMIPNLIGNLAEWKSIYNIAKKHNLITIEDSADTIGYTIDEDIGNKYSDLSTTSFYASHVVTGAGTGGMLTLNNTTFYDRAKLLRGWGRDSSLFNEKEDASLRFNATIDSINYDKKFVFSALGYNFLPSEISAAFGLVQLKNLKGNIDKRIDNFLKLKNAIKLELKDYFYTIEISSCHKTGLLAFPLLITKDAGVNRSELQVFLESKNIQTRVIFTGNITRQPALKGVDYLIKGKLDQSDYIMENGILLGLHQKISINDIEYIVSCLKTFVKK